MDNSSFALIPFSQDNLLVTIALVLVAVLAVLTVIAMAWGARLKRQRVHAEHEEEARIDALEAEGVTAQTGDEADAALRDAASTDRADAPGRHSIARPDETPARDAPPPAERHLDDGAEPRQPDAHEDAAPAAPVATAPVPVAPAPPPIADAPAADTSPLRDEPIAAAAPLDASPAFEAATAADAAPATDDPAALPVTTLKGLGPKIGSRLNELGITGIGQIAWLDDAEAEALDAQLGAFKGRMARDQWREQARLLAQGDRAGYEAAFGKLG